VAAKGMKMRLFTSLIVPGLTRLAPGLR
jgi:hypothetical protein